MSRKFITLVLFKQQLANYVVIRMYANLPEHILILRFATVDKYSSIREGSSVGEENNCLRYAICDSIVMRLHAYNVPKTEY